MPNLRHIATACAMALFVGLASCGSSANKSVAVWVGHTAITKATVAHWMSVLTAGRTASVAPSRQHQIRQQALQFLITSAWLVGGAASEGMGVSDSEVHQRLADKTAASFPGGEAELGDFLKASGQSIGDLELEARAELASARLHQVIQKKAGDVTHAQIAAYYAQHKQSFVLPERREATYTGRKSWAAAEQVKKQAEAGAVLASAAQRRVGEIYYSAAAPPYRRDALERGIFASIRNKVSGPFKDGATYYLFELTKVVPSITLSLAAVEDRIGKELAREREQSALTEFTREWRTQWAAKTDCQPGYVIQQCRQYLGPRAPEGPLPVG